LGYPSNEALSKLRSNVKKSIDGNEDEVCNVCLRTKQTRLSFLISDNKALNNFYLIHCNIWGAYRVRAFYGLHYFLSVVHHTSWGVWVYFTKDKSEASEFVKIFCHMVITQFKAKVIVIRSDNESEFASGPWNNSIGNKGLVIKLVVLIVRFSTGQSFDLYYTWVCSKITFY